MGKGKRLKRQRHQEKRSAAQQVTSKPDARDATLAQALHQATSPAGRARTRQYIEQCGSPVNAAKGVYEAFVAAADKPVPDAPLLACRSGCWFCCTIPVAVTPFEVALVMGAIEELPQEEREYIWTRLRGYIDAQNQAVAEAQGKRVAWSRRCPLLTDDGRCSVYARRPLVCRGLLSIDADRCRRAFLEDDDGDPASPFMVNNNAITAGIAQLMVTLNEGKLDHYPNYDLASALYAFWTNPDLFREWQQGCHFAKDGFPRMAEGSEVFPTPGKLPLGPP